LDEVAAERSYKNRDQVRNRTSDIVRIVPHYANAVSRSLSLPTLWVKSTRPRSRLSLTSKWYRHRYICGQ
jgi:hypothetical protein